ncbi:CpaF family protein [Kineosporia rhizophila]|uniref:CpaF family protein n=1 Tax=Kineosporia TaxID=49184 RepID=UPI001E567F89|nr:MULTISPECIES: CpaF family protein [Kineosporia]MCE0534325.1 CpaF family protein [Kineosporia rhizophila]GLY13873.1 secretion protein [Kineosporia sp. NBRC 101677]
MGLRDLRSAGERGAGQDAARQFEALVERYRRALLEELNLNELSSLDPAQRRTRLERVLARILSREGPMLSGTERTQLIRRVIDDSLGLGVLEPLLADPSVTEIMVNGPKDVYIERAGRLERAPFAFASEEQLYQTIDRIVSTVNRRVDESSPMVDARLAGGERVNVVIPPLSLTGPTLTIRRFPAPIPMHRMAEIGAVDTATALLLASMVRARFNVLISGGTGTGKTTMLNALSAFIPTHERIITVEDAAELRLEQEHVVSLEARPSNIEGRGEVTIRDLVRNSLRMRPDRIIVGEVRGGETLDMLQAMNTGHEGSLATVHANSTQDAVSRLETLATMSELELPFAAIRDQINNAIDVIIQLSRFGDGSRRVVEVIAVTSKRREEYRLERLMHFEAEPTGADRVVVGRFVPHRLPAALADRLIVRGELIPPQFLEYRR